MGGGGGRQTSSKAYWFMLKRFLKNKKIPLIPPIFDDNEFVTDFKNQLKFSFYSLQKQSYLINNNSKLWTNFT